VADADDKPDGCWVADFASTEDSERASSWSGSDSETWEAAHANSPLLTEWEDLELQYPKSDEEPHTLTKSAGGMQAIITAVKEAKLARIKLYDSSATWHLCPYRKDFTTYQTLKPPLYLNAANKQQFPAMGMGSMVIHMLLGAASSEITLENILYAPAVGYTLVSLGVLDSLGYHMSIDARELKIMSPAGSVVARVPRTTCRLYRISHEEGGYAVKVVSVMELHRRMGHIAPTSARKLVEDRLVTRITLDPKSHEEHCDACIYMHMTH
jgi:hypothetical protein